MEIKEIQSLLLELLREVDDNFKALGVNYYLAYGTLLGAKRHKGFIPWDDDIDLFVPREDFLFLEKEYNLISTNSFFYSSRTNNEYFFPFAKISLKSTQSIKKTYNTPKSLGVSIDIFPIDMLPSANWKREICFYIMKLLNRSIGTYHKNKNALTKKDLVLWAFGMIIGFNNLNNLSNRMEKKLNRKQREWVGNVVWGSYHHADIFPFSYLGKERYMEFENLHLKVPEKTEELLTQWYNEYMKLPSKAEIEKCAHHFNDLYEMIR